MKGMFSDKTVHKIQMRRRQPSYGKLLKMMQSTFSIMLFEVNDEKEIYMIGKGGFGKCYLGKICDNQGN